ncbi:MAG: diguanylate cyclase [Sulfurimonas sp.]|jgi:diguanylate cyclase (GGDEF)-like protein|uniref:GGDEF domain-containing protein n=1 Tax=Sulfurimonas sp. TaxID=2022749 RepID=UPI003568604B
MKHSIKKIFKNLSLFLFGVSLFAGISFLITVDNANSHIKINNLNNQKSIVSTLLNLPKNSIEVVVIELNGKNKQLNIEIEKLRTLYSYNFIEKYMLSNSKEYLLELDELASLSLSFSKEASLYYQEASQNGSATKEELEKKASLLTAKIDSIVLKAFTYNQAKFDIHKNIALLAFILILAGFIWYKKRLETIYKDLEFLFHINYKNHTIFSEEIGAISLRIQKKPVVISDQTMIDPVTEINNLKGLSNSYTQKRGMKDENFTSLSILEIDNFSITNKAYSQELTQAILKKIAYVISLHEQVADVIARTDYNQFTIILSRAKKEESFTEIDNIRKSISELKMSSPELGEIKITLSGGHIIKPNNLSLEEAIIQAKKVLRHAQENGKNRISQVKDLAQSEL